MSGATPAPATNADVAQRQRSGFVNRWLKVRFLSSALLKKEILMTLREQVLGHQLADPNAIHGFFGEYRWLSNFHICPVVFEGRLYPSSENAFQAAKTANGNREPFVFCTPAEAKEKGKRILMSDSEIKTWDVGKAEVMRTILEDKFSRRWNRNLVEMLIDTGDKYLEETNWWYDRFWGVCAGEGDNHLGNILMSIRKLVR